ncbi:hypothetical protein B0H14DRAFT_3865905 [Mycena olivaceomarginata]|nr:hypothetical protein B0H14DRAFT_3865905 [Mycena olivaceomarginata]
MRTRWPSPVRSIVVTVTHTVNLRPPCAISALSSPQTLDACPMRGRPAACTPITRRSHAQFLPLPRSISAGLVLDLYPMCARCPPLRARSPPHSILAHARSIVSPRFCLFGTSRKCGAQITEGELSVSADLKRHQAPVRMLRQRYPCSFSVSSPGGSGPNLILTLAGMHNSLSKCFYPTDVSLRPNSPTTLSLAVGASYLL